METMFDDLEDILAISDKARRFHELEKCAADVGVLASLGKKYGNNYNEQQLVIGIYDGYTVIKASNRKNRRFGFYASLGAVAAAFLILSIPKAVTNYMRLVKARQEKLTKAYKGIDDKGKIVKDE